MPEHFFRSLALALLVASSALAQDISSIPFAKPSTNTAPRGDWLLGEVEAKAKVERLDDHTIVMSNGLVSRTWTVKPNVACIAFDNLVTGESLLRAVSPEAVLVLEGNRLELGGLAGQVDRGYLGTDAIKRLRDQSVFDCFGVKSNGSSRPLEWNRRRQAVSVTWPPKGVELVFQFNARNDELAFLLLEVHYALYDGAPLFAKWIEITNPPEKPLRISSVECEVLAMVEGESVVDAQERWRAPDIYFESNYEFHGMTSGSANRVFQWLADPAFTTQVNYELKTPCTLVARPPLGPGVVLEPGGHLESMRIYEMPLDSSDRERAGLAQRRMYRTIAPWVTENPLLFHCTTSDTASVKAAIDQAAAVGFEMVILSFGSGFDVEDMSDANIARAKELADYAHSKKIELGSYSLLASRAVSPEVDVIDPATNERGHAIFGNSPCLATDWGAKYFADLKRFYELTGFDVLEHDGSYPGDVCASTTHSGHRGLDDSQWTQWRAITGFYEWCRAKGIYLNVPDYYFLSGSNKTGMGYRETNWSLPREQQLIHARQNIYDGTWTKTPSMGWMFVPLTEYHGGGAAATLEPLSEHLADYEQFLALNLGAGVQACWRGPRLYDTDATKALVTKWVAWFVQHRTILESDIVHIRRADGRDIDGWVHVDPKGAERALAMFFNPLDQPATREFAVPLHYAALREHCTVRERDGEPKTIELDRDDRATLEVKLPPRGITWFVFGAASR